MLQGEVGEEQLQKLEPAATGAKQRISVPGTLLPGWGGLCRHPPGGGTGGGGTAGSNHTHWTVQVVEATASVILSSLPTPLYTGR